MIIGLILISLFWSFYSRKIFIALEKDVELRVHLYGGYLKYVTQNQPPEFLENLIFEKAVERINFPVVVTDANGNPKIFRNIPEGDTSVERLKKIVKKLDSERPPVPLNVVVDGDTINLGSVHFGFPDTYKILRYYPLIQFLFIGMFIILGFMLLFMFIKRENDRVWTMFAKETAHQLGTPISSLAGWLEMIKKKSDEKIILEMEKDIERMKEIVERFSRIGRISKKEVLRIHEIIDETAEFLRRRAPSNVEFKLNLQEAPPVKGDKVLLSWVFENIMKNSIDAIGKDKGIIEITGMVKGKNYEVLIKDTGRGIERKIMSKIFSTGFTTKPYGWGMGLSLAKRVIEKYHGGKIRFVDISKGSTTILISIPVRK